jgi:hypothetical protein
MGDQSIPSVDTQIVFDQIDSALPQGASATLGGQEKAALQNVRGPPPYV